MGNDSSINQATIPFGAVQLSLAQTSAPDSAAQDISLGTVDINPGITHAGGTGTIPSELHESHMPPSLSAAIQAHGLFWLLSAVRQALVAKWQLRTCNVLGKWVRVRGKVRVHNEGTISIADRVRFRSETAMSELVVWKGGLIEIGEATTINYGTSISAASAVKIGRNCLVGTYVNIMDSNFHNASDHSWNMDAEPVVIEDDVWLGNRCMIMKGITVGRGSVVAACSLVTKNVPPRSLVVGVPARLVQHL